VWKMLSDEPVGTATEAECAGLVQILKRRYWVWGWFFAAILAACVGGPLLGERFGLLMIGWAAVWIALILRHAFSRCPRCGRLFNMNWEIGNPFTQRCLNCGLELHAGPRTAAPQQ
jgi:hypothetical protein